MAKKHQRRRSEDPMVDLEKELDDLRPQFHDEMGGGDDKGDDEDAGDMDDMGDDDEDDADSEDESIDLGVEEATDEEATEATDKEVEEADKSEAETMREYVEKVTAKMGDNGANTKSTVASANDMGGDASNLVAGGEADSKGTTGGLEGNSPKEDSMGNINVPGGKAAKSMKAQPKGHGAEKKSAGETADNKNHYWQLIRVEGYESLSENLTFHPKMVVESTENSNGGKDLFLKGICIQGGVRNANERVYPVNEIGRAVKTLNDQITEGYSVLGEVDHPEGLNINLDRVSHMMTNMWMEENNGYGKMKILPTPMGQLVKTMLESGVKLGVSSRGSGEVNESGNVSGSKLLQWTLLHNLLRSVLTLYEHLMNAPEGTRLTN